MDPVILTTAVIPLVGDIIKRLIGRFTGGAKPQTVDEYIKIEEMSIRKAEAIAKLDQTSGDVSRWVADLRASQRPIMAYLIIVTWITVSLFELVDATTYHVVSNLAGAVTMYWFGERTLLHLRDKK